jgi:hypothetical protein
MRRGGGVEHESDPTLCSVPQRDQRAVRNHVANQHFAARTFHHEARPRKPGGILIHRKAGRNFDLCASLIYV